MTSFKSELSFIIQYKKEVFSEKYKNEFGLFIFEFIDIVELNTNYFDYLEQRNSIIRIDVIDYDKSKNVLVIKLMRSTSDEYSILKFALIKKINFNIVTAIGNLDVMIFLNKNKLKKYLKKGVIYE